jgi:DNA-binding transcriptional LysR family regulator
MSPFSRFSQYFVEVARTGSLRKAAETLHVSASAINRQILLAEQTMETPLFERLPTGLKLTSAGEMLFDDIKRWRKEFIRTRERFDEMQGLRRGHVSISIIAALSEGMVAQLIADVGKEFPYLTFNIRIEESRNISEHVSSSEVDFGLRRTADWHCHAGGSSVSA